MARVIAPEIRLYVSPFSKLTRAAISSVQKLLTRSNFLGERWGLSLTALALFLSRISWVRLGREEPATRGPGLPRSWKARMMFPTVWEPHPKLAAISGGDSSRELARSIWDRRRAKASLECRPAFPFRKRTYEDWRFQEGYCSSSHTPHTLTWRMH